LTGPTGHQVGDGGRRHHAKAITSGGDDAGRRLQGGEVEPQPLGAGVLLRRSRLQTIELHLALVEQDMEYHDAKQRRHRDDAGYGRATGQAAATRRAAGDDAQLRRARRTRSSAGCRASDAQCANPPAPLNQTHALSLPLER
jgi:hypothetical protein